MRSKQKNKVKYIIFLFIVLLSFIIIINQKNESTIEYNGKGKVKISQQNGYETTFMTHKKTYKEYKQNKGTWSNLPYWDNQMWDNGCGITAISIIASGYEKNSTPEDLRKKYYPHLAGDKIPEAMRELGVSCTDFQYRPTYFTKEYVTNWLEKDQPISVCVTNIPDDRWTTSSHYLVLLATDKEKAHIYVSNPNGEENTNRESGWYLTKDILPYIVKAIFIQQQ